MKNEVNLPRYAEKLFQPYRYKVIHGGRGSAKSQTAGRALLLIGSTKKIRVLCAREFQNSIADSVLKLLETIIAECGFGGQYTIQRDRIFHTNGTEFIFKGVRLNVESIKSMSGITHLWLEEAQAISANSWKVLIPTIREPNSEIWVTYNPDLKTDPTHVKFLVNKPPPDSLIIEANWQDNPWFPDVLKKEKDYLYTVDPNSAAHIWGGECRTNSAAQIFMGKWVVESFEPETHWDGPYFGADWGFSVDPTMLLKMWVTKGLVGPRLMIEYEAGGVGIELNHLEETFLKIPGSKDHKIMADNSRPETISYMSNPENMKEKKDAFIVEGAEKWKGSVEDGVAVLKSFEQIVIHPRCVKMIDEAKYYCFKTDRLTGDITTEIMDTWNHCWDAVRYALSKIIQSSKNQVGKFTSAFLDNSDNTNNQSEDY